MPQKRDRTGTSFFDTVKIYTLISTGELLPKEKKYPTKFNLACGGCMARGIDACPSLTCDQAFFFERENERKEGMVADYAPINVKPAAGGGGA